MLTDLLESSKVFGLCPMGKTGTLSSSQSSKRGQYKPVDDFDEVAIRNNVQEFYTHRHQLP